MINEITYQHFCDLGGLRNSNCFTRSHENYAKPGDKYGTKYFYNGMLSNACWKGYNI